MIQAKWHPLQKTTLKRRAWPHVVLEAMGLVIVSIVINLFIKCNIQTTH